MAETSDNNGNDQINDIDKNANEAGVDNSDNDELVKNDTTSENENEAENEAENEDSKEDEKEIKETPSNDIKVEFCHIYTLY